MLYTVQTVDLNLSCVWAVGTIVLKANLCSSDYSVWVIKFTLSFSTQACMKAWTSNVKSSIVEERILRFVFVPLIVEERILRFVFVPSIVEEQILRFIFVPSIVEEQILWFVFAPLIV